MQRRALDKKYQAVIDACYPAGGGEVTILSFDVRKVKIYRVTAKGYDGTPVIRISDRTTSSQDKVAELKDCDEFKIERVQEDNTSAAGISTPCGLFACWLQVVKNHVFLRKK